MADTTYQPPPGFMTMKQAQDRLGVSKTTMVAIARRYGLTTHHDVRDSRVKLLRTADIERLAQPMPDEEGKVAA